MKIGMLPSISTNAGGRMEAVFGGGQLRLATGSLLPGGKLPSTTLGRLDGLTNGPPRASLGRHCGHVLRVIRGRYASDTA